MLDDLVELAVDIGAEVLEAVVEHKVKQAKKKKGSEQGKKCSRQRKEPWEEKETPPWEG